MKTKEYTLFRESYDFKQEPVEEKDGLNIFEAHLLKMTKRSTARGQIL